MNTRPDIDKERIEWFSFCQRNGLCLENLYAQKLHYAMPFFEFNAFRAAGIKDVLPFWRKGDLALFRKVRLSKDKRPVFKDSNNWIEREIDAVRIRVKLDKNRNSEKLEFNSMIKGDILPTVSTRNDKRKEANVWTSGNRVYQVNNPKRFLELIDSSDVSNYDSEERKSVSDFLDMIADLEKKEYNNYLDWLYHEMERQID